jgi:hypothetical protein
MGRSEIESEEVNETKCVRSSSSRWWCDSLIPEGDVISGVDKKPQLMMKMKVNRFILGIRCS